jgi:hypothetical protein
VRRHLIEVPTSLRRPFDRSRAILAWRRFWRWRRRRANKPSVPAPYRAKDLLRLVEESDALLQEVDIVAGL